MGKSFGIHLAKLLISTAWSDGEIQKSEKETLDKLRKAFPDISDEDWVTIKLYMEYPMSKNEVKFVFEEIKKAFDTKEAKEMAVQWIQELVHADGTVDYNEFRFYQNAVDFFEGKDQQVSEIQGKFNKIDFAQGKREEELEDYLYNPVFFRVCKALRERKMDVSHEKLKLRRRCLEASFLARIVKSDDHLHQDEYEGMLDLLNNHLHVPLNAAIEIVIQSLNIEDDLCSLERICDRYNRISTEEERKEFIVVLTEIVFADGVAQDKEIATLKEIGVLMGISEAYIDQTIKEYNS